MTTRSVILAAILFALAATTLGVAQASAQPAAPAATLPLPGASGTPPTLNPRDRTQLAAVKPGVVYEVICERTIPVDEQGRSTTDKIKYRVIFPEGYAPSSPRNLVILLHPRGADRLWGFGQYPPGTLGSSDIIVSVDGTTRLEDTTRAFIPRPQDTKPMRDLLLELSDPYATRRVVLMGTEDSALFALAMSDRFPAIVNGVVAHAPGDIERIRLGSAHKGVPTAFVHAPSDRHRMYLRTLHWRDQLVKGGHEVLALRRVATGPGNDGGAAPRGVRDAIDFVLGMTVEDADEALAIARRIAGVGSTRPDPAPLGMVRLILRRFVPVKADDPDQADPDRTMPKPPPRFHPLRPLRHATDAQRTAAFDLAVKIEAFALSQVADLRDKIKTRADLTITGDAPWLGRLGAMREDFRGVDCVEDYIRQIDYDAAHDAQTEAAGQLIDAVFSDRPAEQVYKTIIEQLPNAALVESLPSNVYTSMLEWRDRLKDQGASAATLEQFEVIDRYYRLKAAGEEAYLKRWKDWKP